MTRRAFVLAAAAVAVASVGARAANWPQWRGPGGQGISDEQQIPLEWSSTRNVAWKTPVAGQGHSQPIVWDNRVFLTSEIEGAPAVGHKAPEHRIEGEIFKHPDSVGSDKRHRLNVLAFDLATGKQLWERTAYDGTVFDDRHKRSSYAAATPVTDGTRVYAYFGPEGVYAYDFQGNLVWKTSVGQFPLLGMGTGTSPLL
jgi:outer membrane protein assembly factor BamB